MIPISDPILTGRNCGCVLYKGLSARSYHDNEQEEPGKSAYHLVVLHTVHSFDVGKLKKTPFFSSMRMSYGFFSVPEF